MGEGMVQLIALISLICCLISLALFAGAFYMAKYVVGIQHRVNVLEDSYAQATDHIQKQEELILQLQQNIEYMERNEALASQERTRPRGWNPTDPLNATPRN